MLARCCYSYRFCAYIGDIFKTFLRDVDADRETAPGAVVFLICLILVCATRYVQTVVSASTVPLYNSSRGKTTVIMSTADPEFWNRTGTSRAPKGQEF